MDIANDYTRYATGTTRMACVMLAGTHRISKGNTHTYAAQMLKVRTTLGTTLRWNMNAKTATSRRHAANHGATHSRKEAEPRVVITSKTVQPKKKKNSKHKHRKYNIKYTRSLLLTASHA